MKAITQMLELVLVVVILFATFNLLFPSVDYKNRWEEANIVLKSRDLLRTMDISGRLYTASFSETEAFNFIKSVLPEKSLLPWLATKGTPKNKITIACNCTPDQITELSRWLDGFKMNGREISFDIVYSALDRQPPSDLLFIWGNPELPPYEDTLLAYTQSGKGIIEMSDLDPADISGPLVDMFGLRPATGKVSQAYAYDEFSRFPADSTDRIYQPWKFFHHVPVQLVAGPSGLSLPPLDSGFLPTPGSCASLSEGEFKIQAEITGEGTGQPIGYKFWICDQTYVYFDTDLSDGADVELQTGEEFSINDYYDPMNDWIFKLNNIYSQTAIGVSFRPGYKFHDFLKTEWGCNVDEKPGKPQSDKTPKGWCEGKKYWVGYNMITGDPEGILLQLEGKTDNDEPLPVVFLGPPIFGRAAWISDFTDEGVGDDERLLLFSLLAWSADTRSKSAFSDIRLGYVTYYVNVEEQDVYEVYQVDLGLGFPF